MVAFQAAAQAVGGFLTCLVALPPFLIQLQQRNIPCSVLIISIALQNFFAALNALIWHSTQTTSWWHGKIFCDIEIRIFLFLDISTVGAAACVFRQLSLVFHNDSPLSTRASKRWTRFIEYTLCLGIPFLRMAVYYIVQPDRYWIKTLQGCLATFDTSWPGILFAFGFQPTLSIIALFYAGLTSLRIFAHHRKTKAALGQPSNQRARSRILRLYSFAVILFITVVPLQAYVLYCGIPRYITAYSWSRIHPSEWSRRIWLVRSAVWSSGSIIVQYASIFYGLAITALFALTPDAFETYKAWLISIRGWLRRLRHQTSQPTIFSGTSPTQQCFSNHNPQAVHVHELENTTIGQNYDRDV